jgi:hypothetical protein
VNDAEGGERYVVCCAVDKKGFVGWEEQDYGTLNYLWMLPSKEGKGLTKLHVDAVKKAAENDEEELELGRDPPHGGTFMGGGVAMFPSKTSSDEYYGVKKQNASSYKLTMDHNVKLDYMKKLCKSLDRPSIIVLDKATYNTVKPDIGFNPHTPGTTLEEAVEFLTAEYRKNKTSSFGVLLNKYYIVPHGKDPIKRTTSAIKDDIIAELCELIEDPEFTLLQLLVAEAGIRQFGYPHLILILPVRMPSWDPVELVFAQMKQIFKMHRIVKFKKNGALAVMGLDEYRQALIRLWGYFEQEKVARCVEHVE